MSNQQSSTSHKRNTAIIWFNTNNHVQTDEITRITAELEKYVQFLLISDDFHECNECMNQITDQQCFLIIDEENIENIQNQFNYPESCKKVYILSENASMEYGMPLSHEKISFIVVNPTRLCQRIRIDLDYNNFDFNIVSKGESRSAGSNNLDKQDSSFVYGQVIKHIFNAMCYTNDDLHRMIKYLQDECKNQPKDLKKIEDLKNSYTPTNAVWYYTNYPFLYQRLNTALRTCDVVTMYKMGIFIRDLHHQIVDMHRNTDLTDFLTLYRGILMPVSVFEAKLKGKEGALLSIHEFWSTSKNDEVAHIFAHQSSLDRDVGVLFRINIDSSVSTTVSFASIRSISQYEDEEEYLFTMGTVFRITSIEENAEKTIWCVSLKLTTDHDQELMSLVDHYRSMIPVPNVLNLCCIMIEMGDCARALEIAEAEIEVSSNIVEKILFHFIIGQSYGGMLYFDKMMQHYKKALSYFSQLPGIHRLNPLFIIMTATVLWIEGEIDQALSYLQEEIDRKHDNPFSSYNYMVIPFYHMLKSKILETRGRYSEAVTHSEKANQINGENLPSLHPLVAFGFGQTAALQCMTSTFEEAYEPMKKCRETYQRTEVSEDYGRATNKLSMSVLEQIRNNRSIYDFYPQETSGPCRSSMGETPAMCMIRAKELMMEMRFNEALSKIDQYLASQENGNQSFDPGLFWAHYAKGLCQFECGNMSEASEAFRKFEELAVTYDLSYEDPKRILSRIYTAAIHANQMNDDEVFRILEQINPTTLKHSSAENTSILESSIKSIYQVFQTRGLLCREEKQEEEAIAMFQKSLKIQLTYQSSNYSKLAETYEHIAQCYKTMNNRSEALDNYQKAKSHWETFLELHKTDNDSRSVFSSFLESSKREFLKRTDLENTPIADILIDNPFTYSKLLDNYRNIAEIYLLQNNVIDGIVYYHYALDVQLTYISRTDQDAALLWMKLGKIYDSIEFFKDALDAFSEALHIYLSMVKPQAKDLATIYKSMGYICVDTKEYDAALSHFNECLRIEMLSVRHRDPALADTHRCIGLTLQLQGNHTDAGLHLQQCFEIQKKRTSRSARSSEVNQQELEQQPITSHRSVALTALRERNYQKALEHLEQCLAIQLTSLPNQHLDLVDTYQLIADVMCQTHRTEDAITCYSYTIEILNKHLPSTTFPLIEVYKKLGHLYLKLHQFENSLSAYEEVLTIQLNVRSTDHLDMAATYKQIALVEYIVGQYEDALENFENCLNIQMAALPAHHPDLIDTQSRIGDLRQALNKLSDS